MAFEASSCNSRKEKKQRAKLRTNLHDFKQNAQQPLKPII